MGNKAQDAPHVFSRKELCLIDLVIADSQLILDDNLDATETEKGRQDQTDRNGY